MMDHLPKTKIGFIGAGNMAQAIGEGLVAAGLDLKQLIVSAPSDRNSGPWKALGVKTTTSNRQVLDNSDVVFLAIKPHLLDAALEGFKISGNKVNASSKLYISLLAGVMITELETKLRAAVGDDARVIRVMPNTPILVGEGCSAFCLGTKASPSDEEIVKALLSSRGVCERVQEPLINGIGAMAGSGPAYVYLVIEALADGAVKQGIPRAMATTFAAQTVLGAAKMVLKTGKHPGQLKDEVCSPGGSTICGMHALERAGVRCAFMDAIEAAANRSAEMGKANLVKDMLFKAKSQNNNV